MTELSEESRALLEAEGPLDEPTAAEIDAMHTRVVTALGPLALPQPPVTHPAPLAGKAAAGKIAATGSLKIIGGAVAAAVGSGALLFALNQPAKETPASPPPASVAAPQRPAPAVPPITPRAEPEPEMTAPPAIPAPPPRSAKPAAPTASVEAPSASEEALLVATAEAQLRAGHHAAALALYERHLLEYPKGALRQESQTGRIIALCGMGRSAEARSYVEGFAARHPGSPTALRMQRACGIGP